MTSKMVIEGGDARFDEIVKVAQGSLQDTSRTWW